MQSLSFLSATILCRPVLQPGKSPAFLAMWLLLSLGAFCSTVLYAAGDSDGSFRTYPPGCATVPDVQAALYGQNIVKFYEGRLALVNARNTSQQIDSIVTAYRVACAEPNRSVIWLSFSIPPGVNPSTLYQLPPISFKLSDGWRPYASLSREPGGVALSEPIAQIIGDSSQYPSAGGNAKTWTYILDLDAETAYWDRPISPGEYNGRFYLQFYGPGKSDKPILEIAVPSTDELLGRNPYLPLNGRLSGNWVVDGAADQGFVLSVSELVPKSIPRPDKIADSPLLIFLSWYTFGSHGEPLWLTGSAQILPGETEAILSLDLVSGGKFMSAAHAGRTQAGSLKLKAINCGQINLEYDLSAIGLGAGNKQMKRLFALEIAGFNCNDGTVLQAEVKS